MSYINTCIFRYLYGDGSKCTYKALDDCKYCKRHKKKANNIFQIMEDSMNNTINNETDLFTIFMHIHTTTTNNIEDESIIDNTLENKRNIFLIVIAYLLSKMSILSILSKMLLFINDKMKKKNIILYIYDVFMNTYTISNNENKVYNVLKLQRWARNCLYKRIIKYNKCVPENTEDPFTFDSIDEIPPFHKFSYKDTNTHIYTFNAVELEYFIRHNGNWNPYTKDEIPLYIINQLYLLIQYNKLQLKQKEEFKWQTKRHAFTEVAQIMEKAGFYTDVSWFEKITYNICKNIVSLYRDLCTDLEDGNTYFSTSFELNRDTFEYDFCKEIIELFTDADNHYLLCCNFMKALAMYIKEFYSNLPSWLLNIDSPLPFVDLTNDQNSGLLYMYIQNLLQNIEGMENDIRNEMYNNDLLSRQDRLEIQNRPRRRIMTRIYYNIL